LWPSPRPARGTSSGMHHTPQPLGDKGTVPREVYTIKSELYVCAQNFKKFFIRRYYFQLIKKTAQIVQCTYTTF
jgi:hypothetical protein